MRVDRIAHIADKTIGIQSLAERIQARTGSSHHIVIARELHLIADLICMILLRGASGRIRHQ